jgi:hypothetical protein
MVSGYLSEPATVADALYNAAQAVIGARVSGVS